MFTGLVYSFGTRNKVVTFELSRVVVATLLAIRKCGSINEVARRIGVTRNAITRWADGTIEPHRANLEGLAKVAGVPAEWIVKK